MQQYFFTSDLHFHHQNILKFSPHFRPFANIEEMNQKLIEYWNQTVSSNDVVYNLGDFSFSPNIEKIVEILQQLNGEHHLILGNHDNIIEKHTALLLNIEKFDGHKLLASIQDYKCIKMPDKNKAVLFHYPIEEWQDCHKGTYMLHGHIHDRISKVTGRILNVGFDLHGKFLNAVDIQQYLSVFTSKQHFTPTNHFNIETDIEQNALNIQAYLQKVNQTY